MAIDYASRNVAGDTAESLLARMRLENELEDTRVEMPLEQTRLFRDIVEVRKMFAASRWAISFGSKVNSAPLAKGLSCLPSPRSVSFTDVPWLQRSRLLYVIRNTGRSRP